MRVLLIMVGAIALAITPLSAQQWTFENLGFAAYFDLDVEANGTPHVVYTNCTHGELCFGSPAPRYLIHATKVGGVWERDTVSVDPAGFTPAITLDDTGGVHIVYADSLTDLQYIYGVSGGPWSKESLPHSEPNYFRNEPDIAVDDTGGVHVSYNEREQPWYQYRSASGWIEERVSYEIADNNIARSSIKVGSDGIPRIAFWSLWTNGVVYERIGGVWTANVTGGDRGQMPSMVLDANDAAHVLSIGWDGVSYVTNESGGWTTEVLDADGGAGDLVLTAAEVPIVSYPTAVLGFDTTFFYDVSLFVSVQVDSFWQRQSLVSYRDPVDPTGVGAGFNPRLGIDGVGMLHLVYYDIPYGELVYGVSDVPSAVRPSRAFARPELRVVPNPFNPSTTLHYTLPSAGRVRIEVFDVTGRRVRALARRCDAAGTHRVIWDGRNDLGANLASGVYFVRLETTAGTVTQRAVMLR